MQKKRRKDKRSRDNSRSSRKKTCKHKYVRNEVTTRQRPSLELLFRKKDMKEQKAHAQVYVCWTPDKPHTFTQPTNLPTHNGWEEERKWKEINPNSDGSTCNGKNADQKNKETRIEKRKEPSCECKHTRTTTRTLAEMIRIVLEELARKSYVAFQTGETTSRYRMDRE